MIRTATPIPDPDHDPQPLLSFGAYNGGGIGAHNVTAYRGIALDFDRAHGATFDRLADALRLDGWHGSRTVGRCPPRPRR